MQDDGISFDSDASSGDIQEDVESGLNTRENRPKRAGSVRKQTGKLDSRREDFGDDDDSNESSFQDDDEEEDELDENDF